MKLDELLVNADPENAQLAAGVRKHIAEVMPARIEQGVVDADRSEACSKALFKALGYHDCDVRVVVVDDGLLFANQLGNVVGCVLTVVHNNAEGKRIAPNQYYWAVMG